MGHFRPMTTIAVAALLTMSAAACEPAAAPDRARATSSGSTTGASEARESTGPTTTIPVASTPLTGCSGRSSTTTRNIRYASGPGVDPNLLSLDLTVPVRGGRCGPAPVLVWVHGGGFSIGDKANGMADKVAWAVGNGWAIASVNYRLSPNPPTGAPDRVLHPTHVRDVAAAVAYLVDRAGTLGLDAERVMLAGHSAGAFLVALLGTDPSHLQSVGVDPSRIRAVATLDTRYDIGAEIGEGDGITEAMYRNAFGDDPATWSDASPLTHADAADPPFVVVTRGQASRRAGSATFADALGRGTLVDARPLDHEGVNRALGRSGEAVVTPAVTDLLRWALDRPIAQRR